MLHLLGLAGLLAATSATSGSAPSTPASPGVVGAPSAMPAAAEDPAEWRDSRRAELRRHWDKIEGKPAPSLAPLSGWLNGDPVGWNELRGKVVLVDYWATWCGPCRQGIPHLKQLQRRFADDGLVVLGIHSARGWEKMKGLAEAEKIQYRLAADKERSVGKALGVQYLPSYFAIDRSGKLRVAGANRAQLDAIVTALLAEPAPGSVETPAAGSVSTAGGWPEKVEKRLYADDLRGQRAPAFDPGEWLGAEPALANKVVIYDLWATWCGPCRKGIPKLNGLQQKFGEDVVVVGVSDESADTVRSFMKKTEVDYAMAVDGGKLKGAVGAQRIPHVLVVSSDGIVRWQGVPQMEPDALTEATLQRIIDADRELRRKKLDAR